MSVQAVLLPLRRRLMPRFPLLPTSTLWSVRCELAALFGQRGSPYAPGFPHFPL